MAPIRIFISYRRDDAAGYARAIGSDLGREFGAAAVFVDVDDIGAGQPFADVIGGAVAEARVLLVLIGRRWRGERDGTTSRIFDADDLVRREVAAGLAQRLRVIPVLLDGAPMPAASQLPADLMPLAGLNALELGNTRYAADLERLVVALREALGDARSPAGDARSPAGDARPPAGDARSPAGDAGSPAAARGAAPPRPTWRRGGVALALAGVAIAGAVLAGAALWRAGAVFPPSPAERAGSAALAFTRPAVDGDWLAEVEYDWPNARYTERFAFQGTADELQGTASFLRVPRGVLEGRVLPDGLAFVTRTKEMPSGDEITRRYRARLVDGTLVFVMQAEGGVAAHAPVRFVARPAVTPAASGPR